MLHIDTNKSFNLDSISVARAPALDTLLWILFMRQGF
jgi:hypothetical protein